MSSEINPQRDLTNDACVSIITPVYNSSKTITKMIESILSLKHQNFELLFVIDNKTTDGTEDIIMGFADPRIRLIRGNSCNAGTARNIGIQHSKYEFLFFIDADCIATPDWIDAGLKELIKKEIDGIEGRITYVNEHFRPTFSDRIIENQRGGKYMTANMAYKKQSIIDAGFFPAHYIRKEDRALALKILRKGKIIFCPNMLVYHQQNHWKVRSFLMNAIIAVQADIFLFTEYKKEDYKSDPPIYAHIYYPYYLLALIFPPLVLAYYLRCLQQKRIQTAYDILLLLLIYPYIVIQRIQLWKMAFRNHIFIF